MESVFGAHSLLAASDEIRNQCDPCKYVGKETTARKFCEECKEYLCKDCTDSHRMVTVTREHRIVNADRILGQASIVSTSCKIQCESCNSEEVTDFCEQHHVVICHTCKAVKHRKCNITTLNEKGKSYSRTNIGDIANQIRTTEAKLEQLLRDKNTDLRKLKRSKESCITEIRTFREEINRFLDMLEEKVIHELGKKESQERHNIKQQASMVSSTIKMLKTDSKLLEDAQKTSISCKMFAADIKVSSNLKEYEKLLQDIYKNSNYPVITFKKNKLLNNIKNKINEFGTVVVNYVQNRTLSPELFPDMSVQSSNQVDVKLCEDEYIPTIVGCDVLPNGQIILCDSNNNNVKLLHSSFTLQEGLKLKCKPFNVSVINNSSAIVTLPKLKQLQYIELEPSLKCGRVIQLDKMCWGVQVIDESLYITLHNSPGQGEMRILGLAGDLKKRIDVSENESCTFRRPTYLAVSLASGRMYTSDSGAARVTCIEPNGSVVYQYEDKNLKSPRGLCADAMENYIVCDSNSNNVQIITASGRMSRNLLTAADGVKKPLSVAYRHTDNVLIIGSIDSKNLSVYHLT